MKKIVVFNENFLQDKHKKRLEALGEVSYYTDTNSEEKAKERLKDAEAAVVDAWINPITRDVLNAAKNLKYITLNSIGYDKFDLDLCKEFGIAVSNNAGFNSHSVAEHTIALMFAVIRRIPHFDKKIKEDMFEADDPVKYAPLATWDVRGKTLGIIGLGSIGSIVAHLADALGMNVISHSRTEKTELDFVRFVDLDTLLSESDVVSLHVPLNAETKHMIGSRELGLMKKNAVLINTAGFGQVDDAALADALENEVIFGAGIDTQEDRSNNSPLLRVKDKVVLTPHSAWLSQDSFHSWAEGVTRNIEAYFSGSPRNLV